MLFDTHCHLNFKAFEGRIDEVIGEAHNSGVEKMIVVGTDEETSKRAVEIAEKYDGVYAAVGIHPHHVFEIEAAKKIGVAKKGVPTAWSLICGQTNPGGNEFGDRIYFLERLLNSKKVVAVGEIGIDKHEYKNTKYQDYKIDDDFIEKQKKLLDSQIRLALQYNKSLIIHNRRSREDILSILNNVWNKKMESRTVFHCCEPDKKLFQYAKDHKIFIGIDGDVTYYKEKQVFVQNIPLELLVLETDAPYLMPEPIRSEKKFPNEPKNVKIINNFIAKLIGKTEEKIAEITTNNAKTLFGIS